MDALLWLRDVGSPLVSSVRSAIEWGDYLLGGNCSDIRGRAYSRSNCGGFSCMRETVMPTYVPTQVEELESNRLRLGLALCGQVTVVCCRLLTGHIGASCIGAIVFVVGNKARCSLISSSLTSYVILGFLVGTLDTVDLVQNAATLGSSFFLFPLQAHLFEDLSALSLVLAPVSEFGGVRVAWESYIQPAYLRQQAHASSYDEPRGARGDETMPYMHGHTATVGPPVVHGGAPVVYVPVDGAFLHGAGFPVWEAGASIPRALGPQHAVGKGWGGGSTWERERCDWPFSPRSTQREPFPQAIGWDGSDDDAPRPPISRGVKISRQRRSRGSESTGASSGDAPPGHALRAARARDLDEDVAVCVQCNAEIQRPECWRGTGAYANQAYCSACWNDWMECDARSVCPR